MKPGLDITAPLDLRVGMRRVGLVSLICLLYLVVSGGAYGIEDAVGIAGPRLTLLLCALVPLTLSIPTALMAAELTALMPAEGGFYLWVKHGLGPFAGFTEAYLTLLFTVADTALYPVLFATYLSSLTVVGTGGQLILGFALIWGCGLLNLAGVQTVGRTSVTFTAALLTPFAAIVIIGLPRLIHWQPPSQPLMGQHFLGALGGGLLVVMWNFGGWENLSVVAGEIDAPRRNYLRAIRVAIPMVVLGYFLPLAVTLSGARATADWHAGTFATEGVRLGGPLLGEVIGLGGIISAFAMFDAALLWVSRLPFVLAGEGYLPPGLATLWAARDASEERPRAERAGESEPRLRLADSATHRSCVQNKVPARSIVICCVAFTLLLPLGFLTLLAFDVFFYMAALALEMCALVRLRRLYPVRAGLFVIGGGRLGLYAVVAAPLVTWLISFGFATAQGRAIDLIIAIVLAAGAWPAYAILRRRYGGPPAL